MTDLYTVDTLPTTSQDAIREFSEEYIAALAAYTPDMWCDRLGHFGSTNSPYTTIPISQLSLMYQQTKGDSRFKSAIEKSIDVKSVEYDEGIEAPLMDLFLHTFAYARYMQGPSLLLAAEERFRCKAVATLLENGKTTVGYDGEYFFDTDHPVNPGDPSLSTYSNYNAGALDVVSVANIEAQIALMQANTKDESGEKLSVDSADLAIGVPTAKYEAVKNLLKKEMIAGSGTESESNPYAGGLEVVHMPQLTDANDWYLINKRLVSMIPPWFVLKFAAPGSLSLRHFDESSDFFRNTGKIKSSSHIWYGVAYGFPQAIRRVTGA